MGIKEKNFGYLGANYQIKLIGQILLDKKFGEKIIAILETKYFDTEYFRYIIFLIKNHFEKYEVIPSIDTLQMICKDEIKSKVDLKYATDVLNEIENIIYEDYEYIQEKAINFAKQQILKRSLIQCQGIMEKGDFENYNKVEGIISEAINCIDEEDESVDVFHAIENVLAEDFRQPIKTGIPELDTEMNGGLAKKEVAVVLAPLGTGKTTLLTKFANSAYNEGQNVLQIVFEDGKEIIQRKHLACWSGIDLNDLHKNKHRIGEIVNTIKERKNRLVIKKYPAYGTTVGKIRNDIKKMINDGFRPDIVTIDYVDCIKSEVKGESWQGEDVVMRKLEALSYDFDFACWVATQGGRGAIGIEVVTTDKMAGNIKKAMIAHFIMSIGKTMEQKEFGTATISILKSRFGNDGTIFEDVIFNNSTISFDFSANSATRNTFFASKENKKVKRQEKINNMFNN